MKTELNTLLITLYVHLDDRILPAIGFTRDRSPGRKPALNDVELLCWSRSTCSGSRRTGNGSGMPAPT